MTGKVGAIAGKGWLWPLVFFALAVYVFIRLEGLRLYADVVTADGIESVPNTFASVDHPFHIARAETLWREIAAGRILRWVGQHQGGYPIEFYPLGEAWLEVTIRALSVGALTAAGAHTLAVAVIFLAPGLGYLALCRIDRFSPAVALLAFVLHLSLPGGWYDGGYTELVQWGLVTNVAGATATFLVLPPLVRYLTAGPAWTGAVAACLAAAAVYANPRSAIGLVAIAAMLTAPQLLALARFGNLYAFVHYDRYEDIGEYLSRSAAAVTPLVGVLALAGLLLVLAARRLEAGLAVATALVLYVALTLAVAFVPLVAGLAPQLEPTRLMPLQRLLSIYLASIAVWSIVGWATRRFRAGQTIAAAVTVIGSIALLLALTRPLHGAPPDPASPVVPPVSLYPVLTSAHPEQVDFEAAVRAADAGAAPGTALLVIGSVLSWHQQLWAPLWTNRPLFYDNWLWFWHPDHAGTPGYAFPAGHHYPDPEATLDPVYLARHGIGGVVIAGPAAATAAASPWLRLVRETGVYAAYAVIDPVTTVTVGERNASESQFKNGNLAAAADVSATSAIARVNWFPRWEASADGESASLARREDGSIEAILQKPAPRIELRYALQPIDWVGRGLVLLGLVGLVSLICGKREA